MPESLKNPMLRELLNHWKEVRKQRAVPYRSALDLMRVQDLLPNLLILESDKDHESYICRIAGDRIKLAFKREVTGQNINDLLSVEVSGLLCGYIDSVRESPAILRIRAKNTAASSHEKAVEILILPLSDADNYVIQVLAGFAFDYDPAQEEFDFDLEDFDFEIWPCRDLIRDQDLDQSDELKYEI